MWATELPLLVAPFSLTQVVYWYLLYYPKSGGSLAALLVKCLPVTTLALYIWNHEKRGRVANLILVAMIFSVFGDAFLVYDSLLPMGVASFAVSQVCFILAFGFEKLRLPIGLGLYTAMAFYLWYISFGFPPGDATSWLGIPAYSVLLFTTAWRALARAKGSKVKTHHLSAVGSMLFVVSDCLIVYNMYVSALEMQQILIMSTYYAAQFLITLSAAQTFVDDAKKD